MAAALLPTVAIFVVVLLNMAASLFFLYDAPHTLAFTQMMVSGASSIIFRIIEIHIFMTLISVKQANRAAELARLEHDLHTQATEELKQKEQVEWGMQAIIQAHTQVDNGNLAACAHLTEEHVLWQIAVPLNNLLGRYQQATRATNERDGYVQALSRLVDEYPAIRRSATRYLQEYRPLRPALPDTPRIPSVMLPHV